jgi:Holliday junction resolvase
LKGGDSEEKMRNYEKGRRWEWKVKKQWEAEGYIVKRVAGSKGTADLIAVKDSQVYFIQVKVNRKPTQTELDKLIDECAVCGAFPVVVVWNSKKRQLDTIFVR